MGHASIAVTLDTYGHLMPDMESTLADDIENLRYRFVVDSDAEGYDGEM
jgi:integrase